ncbi:hypothetical protein MTsPCn5_02410 [Croceitalea sp. MTPC5]|uniref:SGNH/GDSL hydrolase family protein n=1 Tax=Croceitalea sp. MTPC5 TaxID=3056565 RepID=UPI002B392EB9|nr:hypothetical protein MTsPCn5_02410 [Croceitalea sp. MTPC5]
MKKTNFLPISIGLNLVLFCFLLFFSINTKTASQPEVPPSQEGIIDEKGNALKKVNIVMLGNSITYQGDWDKVLDRNDVFNGGKPGWTTQQLSWVIKNFIVPYRPKLCFFKGGINDLTLGISSQRIYENMTMVMDSISKVGTKPIYTTTLYQRTNTERNRTIDSINAKMKLFCEKRNYDFLDLRPFLCQSGDIKKEYVIDDNTHLKPQAYPQWALAMAPILTKYGLNDN